MTEHTAGTTYAFLCGADMDPVAIRRRAGYDAARFVAIGATTAPQAAAALPGRLDGEVWGIVLRVPEAAVPPGMPVIAVTLRDGSRTDAILLTTPDSAGTGEAILAQARYWELPVAWRQRLQGVPEGGWHE